MLGITIADCYPVLVFDPIKRVAAVIHVGWRGASNGIIGKTIDAMQREFGCDAAELKVTVGPGISAERYVVGKEVRDAFRDGVGSWPQIAEEIEFGQWKVDLQLSCQLQLEAAGIANKNLELANACTWSQRELFFSHRRDEGMTGRQMGFVLFNE